MSHTSQVWAHMLLFRYGHCDGHSIRTMLFSPLIASTRIGICPCLPAEARLVRAVRPGSEGSQGA